MPNLILPEMGLIDDLSKLSAQLNQESAEVNQILSDLEKKLVAMGFGFDVWLDKDSCELQSKTGFDPDSEKPFKSSTILGFGKIGSQWALLTRQDELVKDPGPNGADSWSVDYQGDPKRLLQASRELRIEALDKIESLLEAIQKKLKGAIEATEKARTIVDKL